MGEFLAGIDDAPVERETGIEPASLAWKAKVLPLNYSRVGCDSTADPGACHGYQLTTNSSIRHTSLVEEVGFEPT
jgi:hypothetical protein